MPVFHKTISLHNLQLVEFFFFFWWSFVIYYLYFIAFFSTYIRGFSCCAVSFRFYPGNFYRISNWTLDLISTGRLFSFSLRSPCLSRLVLFYFINYSIIATLYFHCVYSTRSSNMDNGTRKIYIRKDSVSNSLMVTWMNTHQKKTTGQHGQNIIMIKRLGY